MSTLVKIALAGNPNSGKSSLFNELTGLKQKVGNFPGVTVDKKTGIAALSKEIKAHIIDLPGTYSLYPKSADEFVAYDVLMNPEGKDFPDMVVVVADASNLKRSLLFCSQIMDLKVPVILALTMWDIARAKGTDVDVTGLERELGIPVVVVDPRKGKGIDGLKKAALALHQQTFRPHADFIPAPESVHEILQEVKTSCNLGSLYAAQHTLTGIDHIGYLPEAAKERVKTLYQGNGFHKGKLLADEVMQRYERIEGILQRTVVTANPLKKQLISDRMDKVLLHPIWGNLILLLVLLLMFQVIFWLADFPMQWIDGGFAGLQGYLSGVLPEAWWSDLLINGIVAGIGGIVIFVPQIALLFGIITLLEDSGYMARISFLTDRLMRSVGLNGRSVMPLISGMACAIPAVMAARTIENPKERLITILVTPLMSCSARLPIYVILIALIFPNQPFVQGLVMTGMYLLGFVMALLVAKVMSWIMRKKENSVFLMELPVYRAPRWKNALETMYQKSKIFVVDAGKVILVISIILWALASYGPAGNMQGVEDKFAAISAQQDGELSAEQEEQLASEKLEYSYAGILGKAIEPVITPLGYDWKMGIALISSFAAREVFVGTMATLYSVGSADEDDTPLREKMATAKRPDGSLVYTLATGLSLMVFYAFAMQCMSTIAIVKRETKTWKWPLIQLVYLTLLAYVAALLVYQVLK